MHSAAKLLKAALYNEIKARHFFKRAAGIVQNQESKKIFIELSAMEYDHTNELIKTFSGAPCISGFNPKAYIIELESSLENAFTNKELETLQNSNMKEVLELAISLEKESRKTYLNLAELLDDKETKIYCRALAKEEEQHANSLARQLRSI